MNILMDMTIGYNTALSHKNYSVGKKKRQVKYEDILESKTFIRNTTNSVSIQVNAQLKLTTISSTYCVQHTCSKYIR